MFFPIFFHLAAKMRREYSKIATSCLETRINTTIHYHGNIESSVVLRFIFIIALKVVYDGKH